MDRIVDIQIERLQKLLAERKITISLDDKAKSWLANAGYDPIYGARPLKRVIQRNLQDPLANLILEGDISDGGIVDVSAGKRGLIINGHEVETNGDALGLMGGTDTAPPRHAVH
jgi:ATP-dependent Clp protease ATP-binding subunit ClpB